MTFEVHNYFHNKTTIDFLNFYHVGKKNISRLKIYVNNILASFDEPLHSGDILRFDIPADNLITHQGKIKVLYLFILMVILKIRFQVVLVITTQMLNISIV